MVEFKEYLKIVITLIGTNVITALGGWDKFLYGLLVFIGIDYITGVARAIKEKKLSSYIGFMGIAKKIFLLLVVILATTIDIVFELEGNTCRTLSIVFYMSNEIISIGENLNVLGVPFPEKLKDMFKE